MTWFERLTGFAEESPEQVRDRLVVAGDRLVSKANGRSYTHGTLETPTLAELRQRVAGLGPASGTLTVREQVADVQRLHTDPANAGALFQVASQFNLLEMVSPERTPEDGVGIYEYDRTQGPACAIAAGAGTIYRNYFVPVRGQVGQTAVSQINCLADIGQALGNGNGRYWQMRNGYALPTLAGLTHIDAQLQGMSAAKLDDLRGLLRVGIQWQTQVTLNDCTHLVSQIYCSALPVAYASLPPTAPWERFARLVLTAAYEATLCTAVLNLQQTGSRSLYLTLLGGGVFGNSPRWILDSIDRALTRYRSWPIDAVLVSYGQPNPALAPLIHRYASH